MPGARPYDQLKRHLPTNLAILAVIVSAAMPVISVTFMAVPHGYVAARSHPLYWLLMAPLAVWAWGAVAFDAWAIRLVAPLLVIAPAAAALAAVLSTRAGGDGVVAWVLAAGSLIAACVGALALARSPLWPLRRR